MNQTEQYQLNQWDKSDRIMMEDFNADNLKTEQALADHAALLAKCGNCRIATSTYTGTGEYGEEHPNTLTFDAVPAVVLVLDPSSGHHMILFPGQESAYSNPDFDCRASWNGNSVSWYSGSNSNYQCNFKNEVYTVVALFQLDA